MQNLLPEPPATLLPIDEGAAAGDLTPEQRAARFPASGAAWATLAEEAFAGGRTITAYAYARTGYHRGLDQLRRSGWKGFGPIPFDHEPNQGFLRALAALATAAQAIGDVEEYERCRDFLADADPE